MSIIGNATSKAENNLAKKSFFELQKVQEQKIKPAFFAMPEAEFKFSYFDKDINSSNENTEPKNYVEIPKTKHEIAEEFYVDNNGNIDLRQLSKEEISKKYADESKYNITSWKNFVWVYEKNEDGDDKKVCLVAIGDDFIEYEKFYYEGEKQLSKTYVISKDGKLKTVRFKEGYNTIEEQVYNNNYLVYKRDENYEIEYVAYENLKKELAVNHIDQRNISKIKVDIYQRLNKDNILGTFSSYDIITAIEKSKALPKSEKEKMINHITSLLYDTGMKISNSKIENDYYQSKKTYNVHFSKYFISIHDNSYKREDIDLWQILRDSDNNEFEKIRLKKLLQEMPPEALMDFAKEVKRFKIQYANTTLRENGHYSYDDTPQGSGANETVSVIQSLETLMHELGHAMDYSYNNPEKSNQSKAYNNEKFQDAFLKGMERYHKAGYTPYSSYEGYESVEYQQYSALSPEEKAERGYDWDSNYCTYNIMEMMAECYTLLMLGDCKSKNVILKYFPDCLQCAKEIIDETRKLSDEERIKP